MEVQPISGGYRYTGVDAANLFIDLRNSYNGRKQGEAENGAAKGTKHFLITTPNRKKADGSKDMALEGTYLQAYLTTKWTIIEAEDEEDAYNKLKEYKDQGYTIGNVIFDSHGEYEKAKFNVGGSKKITNGNVNSNVWLKKMKELFSGETTVLILACHVGNFSNSGNSLLQNLANMWNVGVIGNQSWTSPAVGMFMGAEMSWDKSTQGNTSERAEAKKMKRAIDCYGKWTYATPNAKPTVFGDTHYFEIKNGNFQFVPRPKNNGEGSEGYQPVGIGDKL